MLLTTCCAPDVFASALLRMRCIAVVSPSGIRQSGKGGSTRKGVRHAKGLCHGTRCGFEQAQGCLLVRSSLILNPKPYSTPNPNPGPGSRPSPSPALTLAR